MLHEQISGYLDIKGKTNCLAETFLLLSSNCQMEGTVRGELLFRAGETLALVLWRQPVLYQ